jgi:cysteine desulfurase
MRPYFTDSFGNPSSIHSYGQKAEAAVESARETVASILGCRPGEIVFTACGSESDNLALRGVAIAARERSGKNHILTSRVEHPAVSKTAEQLEKYYGFQVDWLEVNEQGKVAPDMVEKSIREETAIVSVMYANNEIGSINSISAIAEICRRHGVTFHTDAVQAAAYLSLDVRALGADLMSLGGHKFYGPKGVGALYVRNGTDLIPIQTGGGQENDLRAGTQNVAYIVGFAEALRHANEERDNRTTHVKPLRDRVIGTILETISNSKLTGSMDERLPNHASFVFKDVDGNLLLTMLDAAGFACSSGSACKTGNPEPSEVMTAIGLSRDWGLGSLRVTLGVGTTPHDVESFLSSLPSLVEKARALGRH